jgi:hypothetical protein
MRTVTLDDELAALLEGEKPLDEATREALVTGLFRRGKVSTYRTTENEWEADLTALDSWHDQAS